MSWEIYEVTMIAKNEPLRHAGSKMTLTVEEFLKRLRAAYEQGRRDAVSDMLARKKAADDFAKVNRPSSAPFGDAFGGIFGW